MRLLLQRYGTGINPATILRIGISQPLTMKFSTLAIAGAVLATSAHGFSTPAKFGVRQVRFSWEISKYLPRRTASEHKC
jgi:hypothetical protein